MPWEPTPWHWSKHVKIRPSWLFQKGCLSLHNCQTAILLHVGTLNSTCWALHLSISIHLSNSFSCSMKWFLGLALGESCVACATTEKHWCPVSTFSYCRGKAFLGKPATITFGKHKDRSNLDCRHIETVDFITILWHQPWEELVPWEPTPLHGWQTAMLAHVGTLNSARSACSTFHTTFIRAKASVVLSSFFVWK